TVARRPKLRALHSSQYIQALCVVELVSTALYFPLFIENETCVFTSYASAFYSTHIGMTGIAVCKTIGAYVLVFFSYDRFLAVWYNHKFQQVEIGNIVNKRLIITGLSMLLLSTPALCFGKITEISEGHWFAEP
ncbi:unnamed protein product, partial [Meganyctiphanes norvegica]